MMDGQAHAVGAKGERLDVIGHLLNHETLELPFVDSHHLLAGDID